MKNKIAITFNSNPDVIYLTETFSNDNIIRLMFQVLNPFTEELVLIYYKGSSNKRGDLRYYSEEKYRG